jgi:alpha-1,6-mannosyltransferase
VTPMRIVQVANFVTSSSGGLRTTLNHLAEGYAAQGHEVVQVLPGAEDGQVETPWGRQVLLHAPLLPGLGYRLVLDAKRLERTLQGLRPDALEVHDRTTLRGLGPWAQRHDVPSLVVSHERLDRWLRQWLSPRLPLESLADKSNRSLARSFDTVLCTTSWAGEEFRRLGVDNLVTVPLGVDHQQFVPRLEPVARPDVVLVMASRLSKEKRPELAVEALRELRRRGISARLVVAGDGPLRQQLEARGKGLPIEWRGFVEGRDELARLLADADIALAPGPVETFGLAALEALACGTPAVVNRHSALPEVIGSDAGRTAASSGFTFADAVEELLAVPEPERRAAARQRAQVFDWRYTVDGFLSLHDSRAGRPVPVAS